ncbi:hypothetical protein AMIS_2720 [Actinoplanes missouriensis 431]|uniref:Uncharacterized protein n=1 Tax=Actinoplanes missouriensis (strain ATCC 14538 / DSM 43046 / CBS 188.64 / JCM 3121 / NBRC 102363 / NCIMB 12654 / NRRL B-3342 / UNCC 431) TaxID=512565 RepID=I0GXK5_ACTM4|nr:hypothetical protein [Actinoplanes missouriensis]KOX45239.1 hypothetical protein ADL19_23215 [Streptomyces purpurogeneiscleroticus]BAL85492.1 hypothetical protein AMIS_2720 [Actinoplanes missouriensis 431]
MAERTLHAIPVKDCCGVLLGDICDCAAFHAEAMALFANAPVIPVSSPIFAKPAEPPASPFPTPIVLVNVGGLLRRVDGPAYAEEQK